MHFLPISKGPSLRLWKTYTMELNDKTNGETLLEWTSILGFGGGVSWIWHGLSCSAGRRSRMRKLHLEKAVGGWASPNYQPSNSNSAKALLFFWLGQCMNKLSMQKFFTKIDIMKKCYYFTCMFFSIFLHFFSVVCSLQVPMMIYQSQSWKNSALFFTIPQLPIEKGNYPIKLASLEYATQMCTFWWAQTGCGNIL